MKFLLLNFRIQLENCEIFAALALLYPLKKLCMRKDFIKYTFKTDSIRVLNDLNISFYPSSYSPVSSSVNPSVFGENSPKNTILSKRSFIALISDS